MNTVALRARATWRAVRAADWRFVVVTLGRIALAGWFFFQSLLVSAWLVNEGYLGGDFRIYYRAARAWLSGGDPWNAGVHILGPAHFGAPPASLVPVVPFTFISEDQAVAIWVVLCVLSSLYVIRRLRLGLEWLLFPPLVFGVVSGNPSLPVLALLVAGSSWTAAVAAALKVYAVVPLVGERRWRTVGIALSVLAAAVVLAPGLWIEYVQRFGEISARLSAESVGGYSAVRWWPLVPPTLVALVVIARYDLRAAGWLAVPALWPGSEWHWSTMALPVLTPWLGVMLAIDLRGLPAVATWVFAAVLVIRRHRVSSRIWRYVRSTLTGPSARRRALRRRTDQ